LVNGKLMHGLVHPEMGHVRIPHDTSADAFAGACPFHGDCLEGLASGSAMRARWGRPAETLPDDHPGWALEARYLALALNNFICTLSPQRIVLGGGVMERRTLFPLIHGDVQALLNGYVQAVQLLSQVDRYVVPPAFGARAGVLGALALAMEIA
jgi:fructokinase